MLPRSRLIKLIDTKVHTGYNAVQNNTIQNEIRQWQMLETNQTLISQKTTHRSPVRASYGVSFVSKCIEEKTDDVLMGPYYTKNEQCAQYLPSTVYAAWRDNGRFGYDIHIVNNLTRGTMVLQQHVKDLYLFFRIPKPFSLTFSLARLEDSRDPTRLRLTNQWIKTEISNIRPIRLDSIMHLNTDLR